MEKINFKNIYKKYNNFDTFLDRLNFCIEVLKPTTCYKIAKQTQIPLPTITRIKDGKIKNPNSAYLFAISQYFNVTYEWLTESKYFPITYDDYFEKCLSGGPHSEIEILDIQSHNDCVLFNSYDEYKQVTKALPIYQELVPIIIKYLIKSKYLEKIIKNNEMQIIELIKLLDDDQKKKNSKSNDIKELGKKTRFDKDINIEEIRNAYNTIEKKNK